MNELIEYSTKVYEGLSKDATRNITSSSQNLTEYADTLLCYYRKNIPIERTIERLNSLWERPDSDFDFERGLGARPPSNGG